ncbi:MAG: hypothetical protein AAGB34_10465, partial [Planctomycetota bacterium]
MKSITTALLVVGTAQLSSGTLASTAPQATDSLLSQGKTYAYDFTAGTHGWTGRFADLPVEHDPDDYMLTWGFEPAPVGVGRALRIAADNRSDDISMMFARRITGLIPNARYAVSGTIDYLYNATLDSSGIGGSPGASVYLRYGAILDEPTTRIDEIEHIRWDNLDMGNQADPGGENGIMIGPIGTPPGSGEGVWLPQNRSYTNDPAHPFFIAFAAPDASAWLIFGTESGFEGFNNIFYTAATFTFQLSPNPANWAEPVSAADAFDLLTFLNAAQQRRTKADIAAPVEHDPDDY